MRVSSYRTDYRSAEGTEQFPIEIAMGIFVDWAKKNNRNYVSSMVKENLMPFLNSGLPPKRAVEAFLDWAGE